MAGKSQQRAEFGDFQTPPDLAGEVCRLLVRRRLRPQTILEPTCGRGNFLVAAAGAFPLAKTWVGIEINRAHVQAARQAIRGTAVREQARITQRDIFSIDWRAEIAALAEPLLILGNPPWVTSADLATYGSKNVPVKANVRNDRGIDAITGRSNFDISEWMLLKALTGLDGRHGTLAMLCKTSVARRVMQYAWERSFSIASADIYRIDTERHFDASVDACLLVVEISPSALSYDCAIFAALDSRQRANVFGWRDGSLVADVDAYDRSRHLYGTGPYQWRSGIKHDCAKVMEFRRVGENYQNGLGESADLERRFLFPMRKSSGLARRPSDKPSRLMLVTQRRVGQDTHGIQDSAPKTWRYLQRHAGLLDRRASAIYKNRPRFSIFGVGPYTFRRWKVAISGFYKQLNFSVVGPFRSKPVVFDDTCNFISCDSRAEAKMIAGLLNSQVAEDALAALVFWDAKRPITIDLLRRINVAAVAAAVGKEAELATHVSDLRRRF